MLRTARQDSIANTFPAPSWERKALIKRTVFRDLLSQTSGMWWQTFNEREKVGHLPSLVTAAAQLAKVKANLFLGI